MKHTRTLALASLTTTGLIVAGAATMAAPAHASGGDRGDRGVSAAGSCSAGSTWKLKAKSDDGAIEAEFEVDSNVVGQTWRWRLTDNGARVARGTSTTTGPSGSFSVERLVPDQAGSDQIAFRARSGAEVCTGSVTTR